jgi:hypothetical protein
MTLQIAVSNQILINGQLTGLCLAQTAAGTIVYTPKKFGLGLINRIKKVEAGLNVKGVMQWTEVVVRERDAGQPYKEHQMPHVRYSAAHDFPSSGAAGRAQLEADVLALLKTL